MDGIINVLKPSGMTSFDVIAKLRKIYGQKKIGHGGTLDPMAAGVLPVFLGKATRIIEYASIDKKTYEAEFIMNIETDTEDMTGKVISTSNEKPSDEAWYLALNKFRGKIMQVPSQYSAIQINGERAYKTARKGQKVNIPAREVNIEKLEIRSIEYPYIRISVTCSAGTYIRALGRDLGKSVKCPLTMSFLLRTKMGPFDIENAVTLEEINENPYDCVQKELGDFVSHLPRIKLDENNGKGFLQGKRILQKMNDCEIIAVYGEEGTLLGIAEMKKGVLHPRKVLQEV